MSPLASSEFIHLCHTQLQLLAQSLGTSLGVVYLTGDWADHPHNSPIAVARYPAEADCDPLDSPWVLPPHLVPDERDHPSASVPRGDRAGNARGVLGQPSVSNDRVAPAGETDEVGAGMHSASGLAQGQRSAESEFRQPLRAESFATESQVAESLAAESLAVESRAAESLAAESFAAGSFATESQVAESLAAESFAAESLAAESLAVESLTAESRATEQRVAEQITAEPVTAEPVKTGQIAAEPVKTGQVTAETVKAGQVAAEPVTTEPVTAGPVTAGPVTADRLVDRISGPADRVAPIVVEPTSSRGGTTLGLEVDADFSPEFGAAFEPKPHLVHNRNRTTGAGWSQLAQHQMVVPLQQGNFVLGFLVVEREGSSWSAQDHHHLKQVAHSLALACVLERRFQWMQHRYQEQEVLQEQQQDILDTLLHQIRNPLTALRTFGKLLLRRLQADDENRSVAENMVRESDRLSTLLQQLNQQVEHGHSGPPALDLQRVPGVDDRAAAVPHGPPPALPPASLSLLTSQLTIEACDLQTVLAPIVAAAQARAEEQNLQLHTDFPPQPWVPLAAQAQALAEVLSNVVDNALKYTPAGGQVAVIVRQVAGSDGKAAVSEESAPGKLATGESATAKTESGDAAPVESGTAPAELGKAEPGKPAMRPLATAIAAWSDIIVSDTGPGIPEGDRPHLFERHYRGVQAQGDIPGTGIGLAVVKELVEQMGGEVTVLSPAGPWSPLALAPASTAAPDRPIAAPGTAFCFRFPHWPAPPAPSEQRPNSDLPP